jgi:hypothetical protein
MVEGVRSEEHRAIIGLAMSVGRANLAKFAQSLAWTPQAGPNTTSLYAVQWYSVQGSRRTQTHV